MDRPILFSTSMVRAILDGSKTQTRRIVKPQPSSLDNLKCPYGQGGDRLWVRETWRPALTSNGHEYYAYKADMSYQCGLDMPSGIFSWKPSIHMPREASRISLKVVGVRLENLQNISEEDSLAEGIKPISDNRGWNKYSIQMSLASYNALTAKEVFEMAWNAINGEGSWDKNPWVWVINFRRIYG